MTWVVATLVIVVILGFSIFYVSLGWNGGKEITIKDSNKQIRDVAAGQTFLAYLLSKNDGGEMIFQGILDTENIFEYHKGANVVLGKKIFKEIYSEDYPDLKYFIVVEVTNKDYLPKLEDSLDSFSNINPGNLNFGTGRVDTNYPSGKGHFFKEFVPFEVEGKKMKVIEMGMAKK